MGPGCDLRVGSREDLTRVRVLRKPCVASFVPFTHNVVPCENTLHPTILLISI